MRWESFALVVVGAFVLTMPANWLVLAILHRARGKVEPAEMGAGRWIGTLERLLIFVLLAVGEAGAAGLVAAAKTIIRYPEISSKLARMAPEYVLVGSWRAGCSPLPSALLSQTWFETSCSEAGTPNPGTASNL